MIYIFTKTGLYNFIREVLGNLQFQSIGPEMSIILNFLRKACQEYCKAEDNVSIEINIDYMTLKLINKMKGASFWQG